LTLWEIVITYALTALRTGTRTLRTLRKPKMPSNFVPMITCAKTGQEITKSSCSFHKNHSNKKCKGCLVCAYCGERWIRGNRRWHNCIGAIEAKRLLQNKRYRDWYARNIKNHRENVKQYDRERCKKIEPAKQHQCRKCGKLSANYFYCPTCHEVKTRHLSFDALGYDLGSAWF
jgi:hypothetical protein